MKEQTQLNKLMIVLTVLVGLFGISSGIILDNTIISEKYHIIPQGREIPKAETQNVMALPLYDSDEVFSGIVSDSLIDVQYMYTLNNMAYTKEIYPNSSEVIAIPLDIYPNWAKADSVEGIRTRGTDSWNEIAGN